MNKLNSLQPEKCKNSSTTPSTTARNSVTDKTADSVKHVKMKSALEKRIEEDVLMASKVGNVAWLEQSLATKQIALTAADGDGLSAIHLAALECNFECLRMLIETYGMDVDFSSQEGYTALHLCINNTMPKQSLKCVKYLLKKQANPSRTTSMGLTPVHQAATVGHVKCIKTLIEANAVTDAIDSRGHTPHSLAVLWGHRKSARILKHYTWHRSKVVEASAKKDGELEERLKKAAEKEETEHKMEERKLESQKAYKHWLAKNNFADLPMLFGPRPASERKANTTVAAIAIPGRQPRNNPSGKLQMGTFLSKSDGHKSSGIEANYSPRTLKSNERKIDFIPLSTSSSPTLKRHVQTERGSLAMTASKSRSIQKRGTLLFPVL